MVRAQRRRQRGQGLTALSARSAATGGQFVVIGESLVDLISNRARDALTMHAGGSPLNVATGLARLGHTVTFITEYGNDPLGRVLDAHLRTTGMHVAARQRPTNLAVALPGPDGTATYDFRFRWSLGRRDITVSGGAACLHTGSLAAVVDPGRRSVLAAVKAAKRAGITICIDPNIRPNVSTNRSATRAAIEDLIEHADIVKASLEDIAWLYPGDEPVEWIRAVSDARRLAILTDGPRGCIAINNSAEMSVPAPSVHIADTVGAGDTFTAALLSGLATRDALRHAATLPAETLTDVLAFAIHAATITCTRAGAYAPTPADLA